MTTNLGRKLVRISGLPDTPGLERVFYLNTLVASLGFGLYASVSAFYLLRTLGYSGAEVGGMLTVSLVLGVVANPLIGPLSDRFGARQVCIAASIGQCVALLAFALGGSFVSPWISLGVLGVCESAGSVARGALVPLVVDGSQRALLSAKLRTGFNLGFCVASGLAAVGLVANEPTIYRLLIVFNGCCSLFIASQFARRVPDLRADSRPNRRAKWAWDLPYVGFATLSGVIGWADSMIIVGLPLLISGQHGLTAGLVSVALLINTVLVILLQVPVAERLAETTRPVQFLAAGFGLMCLAAGIMAASYLHGLSLLATTAIIVAGVVVLTLAEVVVETQRWHFRYSIPPAGEHGRYSGFFGLGDSTAKSLGPLTVAAVIGGFAGPGWLLLAAGVLVAGLLGSALTYDRKVIEVEAT
jgi:hypothetical protein